jgi:hypothetical protein
MKLFRIYPVCSGFLGIWFDARSILYQRRQKVWSQKSIYALKLLLKHNAAD